MSDLRLKTVTRTQGNNSALKEGSVRPRTCELEFIEVNPLVSAFRRMVRGLEFDICELAPTTYLCARAYGRKFTAIPVSLSRGSKIPKSVFTYSRPDENHVLLAGAMADDTLSISMRQIDTSNAGSMNGMIAASGVGVGTGTTVLTGANVATRA